MRLKSTWFSTFILLVLSLRIHAQDLRTADAQFVKASSPKIVVEGRYITSATGGVCLGFPGVALHCHYYGNTLTMRVRADSDEEFFDVVVDQGKPARLRTEAGEHDYVIFRAPEPSDHTIEISRRTESWQGICEVLGFEPGTGGKFLMPPPLPERKLLFIGDSITCGAMADYDPNDSVHTQHNTQWCNADATFCKALARHFRAQCHLVSYGGRGLIRDWQGSGSVRNAPQFYELALPDDSSSLWDHSRYVPDAVVICLGGNDFNQGVPDEVVFVNAYVQFIEKIERDAPYAWIFLADCPMLKDEPGKVPKRSVFRAYLQQVIAKVNNSHVILAPVSFYRGNPVDGHPTRADHEAMAAELSPVLSKALGWK
jgi:lysophospholipase L1-like esterase